MKTEGDQAGSGPPPPGFLQPGKLCCPSLPSFPLPTSAKSLRNEIMRLFYTTSKLGTGERMYHTKE